MAILVFASDVCRAIGIANHRDAVRKLDDDEKGVGSTDTLGGEQESVIISSLASTPLSSAAAMR